MSKKQKIDVVKYYMTIHYGIALVVDEIRAIIIGEKEAWKGSISAETVIELDKEDLFGGIKKEGGVSGEVTYLPGGASQVLHEELANKMGLTADTCPGYRGLTSIFFHGKNYDKRGFYWSANQPRVPGVWIVARRAPKGLDPAIAMIDGNDGNPIHFIYESLTRANLGVGAPASSFGLESWNKAAQTLYDEKFGISLLWTEQQSGEELAANILTYIDGVIFINPSTGKLDIKLIRDDYEESELFVLDESNSKFSDFQRKLFAETINEIVVTWTNPETEQGETVTVQDIANIAIQGGIVSDNNPYPGVRNGDLAMKLANRDCAVAAAPLASMVALVDRSAWRAVPGQCVKVVWEKHGINGAVFRCGNIDYGKIGDSKIRIALVEDVFSFDTQDYETPPGGGWINPSENPTPLVHVLAFTLPYYFARSMANDSTLQSLITPQVIMGVLGGQPGSDTPEFILATETANNVGVNVIELGTALSTTAHGRIATSLLFQIESTVNIVGLTQGDSPAAGNFVIIGDSDENMEICLVKSTTGSTTTLIRGVLDTTPKDWPADTGCWIVAEDSVIDDETIYEGGEPVTFRALTVTSRGTLPYANAPDITAQLSLRLWMPLRPANCMAGQYAVGPIDTRGMLSLDFSWATRNRVMEDSMVLDWDDPSVPPEPGQTTTLQILDAATREELGRIEGLSGTTYTALEAEYALAPRVIVRFLATINDLDSLQGHEIELLTSVGYGYGFAYGMTYGN